MAFKMKAGSEGPFRKNFPSAFKNTIAKRDFKKEIGENNEEYKPGEMGRDSVKFLGEFDIKRKQGKWKGLGQEHAEENISIPVKNKIKNK